MYVLCFCVGLTKDIRGSDWFWVFMSGTELFAFLTWVFVFDKQSDSLRWVQSSQRQFVVLYCWMAEFNVLMSSTNVPNILINSLIFIIILEAHTLGGYKLVLSLRSTHLLSDTGKIHNLSWLYWLFEIYGKIHLRHNSWFFFFFLIRAHSMNLLLKFIY